MKDRAARRARKDTCLRRHCAGTDSSFWPSGDAAEFRDLVSLCDRLQAGASTSQSTKRSPRKAPSAKPTSSGHTIPTSPPATSASGSIRWARACARRGQAGPRYGQRGRRLCDQLFGDPCRRQPEARTRQGRRRVARRHRMPRARRQGNGAQQQETRNALGGVETGNRATAAEPRNGAHGKLDRSR